MYATRFRHRLTLDTRRFGTVPLWLVFRALPALLLGFLLLLLSGIPPGRASQLEEVPGPDGVQSGYMLLRGEGDSAYIPALMHSSKVHFDISGMVARVVLEQSFRNDSQDWLEGVYAFPRRKTPLSGIWK
jgi:Ca-activated chloride channel family protein